VKKSPDPRVVSWTLTGFVVGVLLTLVATGTLNHSSQAPPPPATLLPAKPVADALLYRNVQRIVIRQLGQAYPNVKLHRLIQLRLDPASPSLDPETRSTVPVPAHARSVFVEFRLYDHPLGKSWRLRSAKADVFSLLKALYTSRLPIYDVWLVGVFPLQNGKVVQDARALVAFIDHPTADRIPWRRWGRDNEARVWSLLDYKHLDSRFA
jgi:hypothetical protein